MKKTIKLNEATTNFYKEVAKANEPKEMITITLMTTVDYTEVDVKVELTEELKEFLLEYNTVKANSNGIKTALAFTHECDLGFEEKDCSYCN